MNKTLTIVRHGKSDWDYMNLSDYDRPLKLRAYSDAYKMAGSLKKKPSTPDLFLSSPANRALYTAVIYARTMDYSFEKIKIINELYLGNPNSIIRLLKKQDNSLNHLAIFGHNPGFTELANYYLPEYLDNVPTSAYVWLEFNTDSWEEIGPDLLIDHEFNYPKKNHL